MSENIPARSLTSAACAEDQAAAALVVGVDLVVGDVEEGDLALGVVVGDLDADGGRVAQAHHLRGGAGVDHGVGDQLAGEDDGVVNDVSEAPALEGVADEGARRGDRAPDRFEGGGCARGDHVAPCVLRVTRLLAASLFAHVG